MKRTQSWTTSTEREGKEHRLANIEFQIIKKKFYPICISKFSIHFVLIWSNLWKCIRVCREGCILRNIFLYKKWATKRNFRLKQSFFLFCFLRKYICNIPLPNLSLSILLLALFCFLPARRIWFIDIGWTWFERETKVRTHLSFLYYLLFPFPKSFLPPFLPSFWLRLLRLISILLSLPSLPIFPFDS